MIAAFVTSSLFLVCYLVYHAQVGSVRFTRQGFVRPLYFTILITHVTLAATVPAAGHRHAVARAEGALRRHRAIARWTLPIWLYVSVTGRAGLRPALSADLAALDALRIDSGPGIHDILAALRSYSYAGSRRVHGCHRRHDGGQRLRRRQAASSASSRTKPASRSRAPRCRRKPGRVAAQLHGDQRRQRTLRRHRPESRRVVARRAGARLPGRSRRLQVRATTPSAPALTLRRAPQAPAERARQRRRKDLQADCGRRSAVQRAAVGRGDRGVQVDPREERRP